MGPGSAGREETGLALGDEAFVNLIAMSPQCVAEQSAWREVKAGWRPLYGDVDSMGVAVEWHDFQTARNFNWGRTFHPHSLEF
jgi:hypothetical protein